MGLALIVWVVLGMIQFLSQSRLTPPLIRAGCFVQPMTAECLGHRERQALSEGEAGTAPAALRVEPGSPPEPVEEPAGAEASLRAGTRVFVQFAGSLRRERVVEVAERLAALGWGVEGASRGGERM